MLKEIQVNTVLGDIMSCLQFSPSLLYLLILLPGIVGKFAASDNGVVDHRFNAPDDVGLTSGCLALLFAYGGTSVTLVYCIYPDWFQFGQLMDSTPSMVVAGSVTAVAAIGVTCWARLTLAGNWVGGPFLRVEHQLVDTGPYRWVRHPMYSGFAGFHLGLFAVTGNVVPLLGDGSFRAILLYQALREERLLARRFGYEYTVYQQRTGRFLPRLNRRTPRTP